MDAVLYICHGSRFEMAIKEAISFVEKTKSIVRVPIQEICFLELASPTIQEAIKSCLEQGATRVIVVPVLLLTAAHAKKDIPNELDKVKRRNPGLEIIYGEPFGVQETIVDVLIERLEAKRRITEDMKIILIGRGSSDPDVVTDLNRIRDILEVKSGVKSIHISFLAAANPLLEELIQEFLEWEIRNVILLPYLLFTGFLDRSIKQLIKRYDLDKYNWTLCHYLGEHPLICNVLQNKVEEVLLRGKGIEIGG